MGQQELPPDTAIGLATSYGQSRSMPTWVGELDKKVTLPPRPSAPGVVPAKPAPVVPPAPAPVSPVAAINAALDSSDDSADGSTSIDVEFSAPDLSVDPLPLTTRKKP